MKKGFSLIELLVVVAIIGVLAGAGIVGYQGYLDGVKKDTAKNQGVQLLRALQAAHISAESGLTGQNNCGPTDSVEDCLGALGATLESPYHTASMTSASFASACSGTTVAFITTVGGTNNMASVTQVDLQACDASGVAIPDVIVSQAY